MKGELILKKEHLFVWKLKRDAFYGGALVYI